VVEVRRGGVRGKTPDWADRGAALVGHRHPMEKGREEERLAEREDRADEPRSRRSPE